MCQRRFVWDLHHSDSSVFGYEEALAVVSAAEIATIRSECIVMEAEQGSAADQTQPLHGTSPRASKTWNKIAELKT